ncbi:phosphoesterase [Candidatus Bathyarchaeota archaeon]|nr:phosphoesterase [Candidatus Bathyarchaeota archaeon]
MSIWIFTHGDGDGLCAGALALAANPGAQVFFTHPYGLLGDLEQVKAQDKVIICDIALSESHLPKILDKFREIVQSGELLYIDHHPLPELLSKYELPGRIYHSLGSSTSELVYLVFQGCLDPLLSRVAIYGAVSDYLDNTPLIGQLLKKWDKRTVYLETGILVQGLQEMKREHNFKRIIISNLANNVPPSFHSMLVDLAIQSTHREEVVFRELKEHIQTHGEIADALNVPFSLGKTAIYTMALAGAIIGIAGEKRGNFIDMSIRTSEKNLDLNRLLRHVAPKYGGSGGGHPAAAGARIPEGSFSDFIKNLDEAVRNLRKIEKDAE